MFFANFLISIRPILPTTANVFKKRVVTYTGEAEGGNSNAVQKTSDQTSRGLRREDEKKAAIKKLKGFYVKMTQWAKLNNCAIGSMVWAPQEERHQFRWVRADPSGQRLHAMLSAIGLSKSNI